MDKNFFNQVKKINPNIMQTIKSTNKLNKFFLNFDL